MLVKVLGDQRVPAQGLRNEGTRYPHIPNLLVVCFPILVALLSVFVLLWFERFTWDNYIIYAYSSWETQLITQRRVEVVHNVDKPEMGVKSLWDLLTPLGRPVLYGSSFCQVRGNAENVTRLETMEGKALAIDSSIWIYQFQATMRDKEGKALVNAHVLGFLRRICKLLFYGIKPVFVFDGGAPALKRNTIVRPYETRLLLQKLILQRPSVKGRKAARLSATPRSRRGSWPLV